MAFSQELPKILALEGGYANVIGDRGGETYKGISRVNFPNWPGWIIVDKNKPLKYNQVIKNSILDAQVNGFYKKYFWDSLNIDQLPAPVQGILFDFAINSGNVTAAKAFQKVLRDTTGAKIVIDGVIGKGTINAANKANQKNLFDNLKNYRLNFYKAIVNKNPTQEKFYDGWINRLNSFEFKKTALGFGVFFFGALLIIYISKK
jgi:lysozyme family protein